MNNDLLKKAHEQIISYRDYWLVEIINHQKTFDEAENEICAYGMGMVYILNAMKITKQRDAIYELTK